MYFRIWDFDFIMFNEAAQQHEARSANLQVKGEARENLMVCLLGTWLKGGVGRDLLEGVWIKGHDVQFDSDF